jgi:hypothetical protein
VEVCQKENRELGIACLIVQNYIGQWICRARFAIVIITKSQVLNQMQAELTQNRAAIWNENRTFIFQKALRILLSASYAPT